MSTVTDTVETPTLFDPPPSGRVRRTDPVTSVAAARRQRGSNKALVLEALAEHGPMCDEELARHFPPQKWGSVKTARSQLSKEQPPRVVAVPGRYKKSSLDSMQQVWQLAR